MTVPEARAEATRAANEFLEVLSEACKKVEERWFLLPVDGTNRDDAYRERVYCYELYHQLRMLTERTSRAGSPRFALSGEIDKAGLNAVVEEGRHKPDLVWHVPGQRINAVVVEAKAAVGLDAEGVEKDIRTLSAFLTAPGDRNYELGVFLVYGQANPDVLMRLVRDCPAQALPGLDRLEVVWHPKALKQAERLGRARTK